MHVRWVDETMPFAPKKHSKTGGQMEDSLPKDLLLYRKGDGVPEKSVKLVSHDPLGTWCKISWRDGGTRWTGSVKKSRLRPDPLCHLRVSREDHKQVQSNMQPEHKNPPGTAVCSSCQRPVIQCVVLLSCLPSHASPVLTWTRSRLHRIPLRRYGWQV